MGGTSHDRQPAVQRGTELLSLGTELRQHVVELGDEIKELLRLAAQILGDRTEIADHDGDDRLAVHSQHGNDVEVMKKRADAGFITLNQPQQVLTQQIELGRVKSLEYRLKPVEQIRYIERRNSLP